MKTPSAAGKGDDCRIGNFENYRNNYDNIFRKKEDTLGLTDEEFAEYISARKKEMSKRKELLGDMFEREEGEEYGL